MKFYCAYGYNTAGGMAGFAGCCVEKMTPITDQCIDPVRDAIKAKHKESFGQEIPAGKIVIINIIPLPIGEV